MKPNFALSLSFEGIRLLHRAQDGWRVVGDVGLDNPDLSGALTDLRDKATALEPAGLSSKLIIPNDQIRYLTLETGDIPLADREAAAELGLDGATPYPVSDLAYAISADGGQTHVAAVARETLAEAEAFAAEHLFNPVSLVAIPTEGSFVGEPFFGATSATDGKIMPDETAIVILPGAPIAHAPEPEAPEPKSTAPEPAVIAADLPKQQPDEAQSSDPAPSVGFASRRAPDARAPSLAGATRGGAATPNTVSAPSLPIDPDDLPLVLSGQDIAPAAEPDLSAPEPSIAASFLSRRKSNKPAQSAPIPAAGPVTTSPKSEAQRLTVFGARTADHAASIGGKPRYLGLMLTAVLLMFLAGVAAWASVFMDDGLARFFGEPTENQVASTPQSLLPEAQTGTGDDSGATITTASLSTGLSSEDAAVLDALRDPIAEPVTDLPQLSQTELEGRYAVTGIWPVAPEVPTPVALVPLEDLYVTAIDPISSANDAVALPLARSYDTDRPLGALSAPAAAGTAFALDDRGLVVPTPEGAMSPDGVTVYLGRPTSVPPKTPVRFAQTPDKNAELAAIAKIRPRDRPGDLVERNERSNLGGLTRSELAELRPQIRPVSEKAAEEVKEDAVQTPNPQAVAASTRPDGRPRNFARLVARARKAKPKEEDKPTRVASVAPRTVTPKIPTKTSVAKEATVRNAIKLNRVNLIGVYGKPSSRRALVRLPNGRYQKVKVGDRIDGGRVSAIGDAELRYKKGSRNLVLKMPKG